MEYLIIGHGSSAVCPNCAGMMTKQTPDSYKCLDCRATFEIIGEGLADKEITIRKKEDG